MSLKKWLGVLLGLGVAASGGCAHSDGETREASDRRLPYLDALQAPAAADAGGPIEVTVSGNFPTPAWEVADVEVAKHDRRVTIRVWIEEKQDGAMIQMLQPFERKVKIEGLTPGTWTVEALGFGDTKEQVKLVVN